MSSVLGEAVVRVRADPGNLVQQVQAEGTRAGRSFAAAFNRSSSGAFSGFDRQASQATRGALAGSGAFTGLGKSLAFASVSFLGTAKAIDIVRDSIVGVANEEKQLERVHTLFKTGAKTITDFANTAVKSLGMVDDVTLQMTADIGQMLIPLGVAPKHAADLSKEVVSLVANLASMRNEDPSIVLSKIEAGLRGRGMGLKAYGIILNDSLLKEEALRQGLVQQAVDSGKVEAARTKLAIAEAKLNDAEKNHLSNSVAVAQARLSVTAAESAYSKAVAGTVPALTQQQKSLAAVQIILKQGARYQGEFAKHSGDMANQSKILHAEIDKLQDSLGYALLPTVKNLVGGMTDWLGKTENMEKAQRQITSTVRTLGGVLSTTWSVFQTGVKVIKPVVDAVGGLKSAIELLLALKIASWVTGIIAPSMARAKVAWLSVGTAATVAAEQTTVATTVMATNMKVLNTSGGINTIRTGMKGIGTDAQTSSGKVGGLMGGLGRLGGLSKIAIPIALALSVTDSGGSVLSQSVQAGILATVFGGPVAGLAAAGGVAAFNLGKWAGGKVFGHGVDAAKDDVTTTIDMKPAALIHAPEGGTVTNIGHSGTVSSGSGAFTHKTFIYQLVFVGDSGASYTFNNVIPVAHEGGYYARNDVIAKAPPGGKVKFHYAHPEDTRIPSAATGAGGERGVNVSPAAGGAAGVQSPSGSVPYQGASDVAHKTFQTRASSQTPGLTALQKFLVSSGAQGGSNAMNENVHTKASFHWSGNALDIGDGSGSEGGSSPDNPAVLVATWNLLARHVDHLAELFWNYGGFYKWGKKLGGPGSDAIAHHRKHIHVAFTGTPQEVASVFGIQSPSGASKGASGGVGQISASQINQASAQSGVPTSLLAAVLTQESGGKQSAVSSAGAKGVMQLMAPSTLAAQNTAAGAMANLLQGAKQLGSYLKKYGSVELALIAYNWGPGNLDNYLRKHSGKLNVGDLPSETQGYLTAILGTGTSRPGATAPTYTVDTKAKTTAARKDIVGPSLANELAAAQRAVTRAGPKGGSLLEDAIRAEMAVDDKVIAAAEKFLAKHPKMKASVNAVINAAKADQASLTVQLANLRKREEAKYQKGQVSEGLVKQILEGLGLSDSAMATRAFEAAGAKYESLTDAAKRRILAAQKKARADLKAATAKGQAAELDQEDVLTTLLGMDPNAMFTETDKWGRQINMSIGSVIEDIQKANRDMKTALASGSKTAIAAAAAEWAKLGPEIGQALQSGFSVASAAYSTAMGTLDQQILTGFDRVTQSHLQQMQRDFQAQVTGMNTALDQQIAGMQRDLQARILSVQQSGALPTPAEAQLAALTGAHDKAALDKQMAAAIAAHDQDQINELLYQQRIANLQKIAATERAARDKDTADKVQKMQDEETLLEQSLRDQLAAQIQAMQDTETAREQDYNDQRDAQRTALTGQLDDWNKHLQDGSASWTDFMAWLNGEVTSGALPGLPNINPLTMMAAAGDAQGSAFAQAYIAQLQVAYKAYQDLLAGRAPSGGNPEGPTPPPDPFDRGLGSTKGSASGSGASDKAAAAVGNAVARALRGSAQNETLEKVAQILVASLTEHQKQTDLLNGGPSVVVVGGGPDANRIALKAAR